MKTIAILLGVLQVTSYQPIPSQTKSTCLNRHNCETSNGDGITRYGVAVSQDMLADGRVHYGDVLFVERFNRFVVVNDCMGPRARNAIDLLVFTHDEEKKIGTRHLKVYLIRQKQKSLEEN